MFLPKQLKTFSPTPQTHFQVTMQQELAGYVKGDGLLKLMLIRYMQLL
jgi:hypothetical protein